MKIRIAHESYQAADAVTTQFWPAHNRAQGIAWKQTDCGLVAFDGEAEVGAATVKFIGGTAYLEQLVIDPKRTRQGIGTSLLEEFERLAREQHCHVMELETAETQARPFYERHGFAVVAEKPKSKFGLTWFFMQKRLDSDP